MRLRFLALCLIAALNACALPSDVVVLLPDETGTAGRISVEQSSTKDELSAPYAAADTDTGVVFKTDKKTVEEAFSGALSVTPRQPVNFVIYFLLGQTELDPRSVDTLAVAIRAARTIPFADISVVGHSDAIGNDQVNFVLSMYRSQTIRAALVRGGVQSSTIDVAYYGSNNPRVPRPRGVAEPENRRVEVTIR